MNTPSPQPVTVIVSRRVKPEAVSAFETLSDEMSRRASQFDGYMGATLFRPVSPDDPEYRMIFKFTDEASLAEWERSEERAEMLEKLEGLLISPTEREKVSGLVTWFSLPSQNPVKPPPRYKMTIVSWLALYPAATLIFWLFGPWLAHLPLLIRTLVVTAVLMILMSYVLMPFMTKRFAFWLFRRH
ncbi:antibiotic biosynthesis monooxygenase [uncultured Alteromonas sp.]|uniref:antibiotic biosynthesis monooxygenase n=1 Tax=uncultured Alteromonas sp. TaxID=179113 RepID=UPI0025F393DA|nr:antibiotic biosynthesis monooxygenase [uncultured Alteromonas sp.]